ncbi:hypothetical protein KC354_g31 [Hortaea werneckii]|nr:hypothetical protein KC354_g31 [Hortaea werneckii]
MAAVANYTPQSQIPIISGWVTVSNWQLCLYPAWLAKRPSGRGQNHERIKSSSATGPTDPNPTRTISEPGPSFPRPRPWSSRQAHLVASTLHRTLETTADNIANDEICDAALRAQVLHIQNPSQAQGQQQPPPPPVVAPDDFTGDRVDTAVYCGLASRTQVLAYPEWHAMGTGDFPVYKHILGASAAALFLQWGTTGASILIAYKTPTAGFGCRSTGYLAYGAIGTAVWFFLLCSALFSHAVMLRYQRIHQATPQAHLTTVRRGLGLGLLCAAAVLTRVLGKFLAFANSIWLILSSLFEMTGAYSNCWCLGNYIGLGNRGWVLLFKSAPDLKVLAQPIWGGGIALTLGVCIGSYLIFVLAFMKNDRTCCRRNIRFASAFPSTPKSKSSRKHRDTSSRHTDRCEGKPVDSPVGGRHQKIRDAKTVAVQRSGQVDSGTMRAELVHSHEVLADAERRGGLGEEASSNRNPLEACVLRIYTMFNIGGFVWLCFGRPDGDLL